MIDQKFIDLASHPKIQAMLTPEVGMWVLVEGAELPSLIVSVSHDGKYFNTRASSFGAVYPISDNNVLLPSLEWLMEKLAQQSTEIRIRNILNTEWEIFVSWHICDQTGTVVASDNTTQKDQLNLAALLALRRVMGIEEEKK